MFDTVLDCEQRLFVLKSLEHPEPFLMNCIFQLFHDSFIFFPELFDYSVSVLNCGHQSWTQYFTSHSVFAHSRTEFIHLAEHFIQMHVQLKIPWFPPVLFRFSSALSSVVSICWSLCCWLCWFPKQSSPPRTCRLCLLIIQPL